MHQRLQKEIVSKFMGGIPFSKLYSLTSASRFDDDASHSLNTKALVDAR
jgi:hypothetical protein